jgi:Flp pilus assembly protein TadG
MGKQFSVDFSTVPTDCGRNAGRRTDEATTRSLLLRRLLRRSRSSEGQTIFEFAMVFTLFIFLVFGVFDFGHLFYMEMMVQNALQEAARFASTGNHLPDPNSHGNNLSRVDSILATVQQCPVSPNITNVQISSANGGKDSAGGPGDTETITVTATVPMLTPMIAKLFDQGRYTFTSSVTVKNEPFPSGSTK